MQFFDNSRPRGMKLKSLQRDGPFTSIVFPTIWNRKYVVIIDIDLYPRL